MSYRATKRDQIAADQSADDRDLMCRATGCPNKWSVDMGSKLCSAHAWAEPHQWPQITQEQQDHVIDRARRAGMLSAPPVQLSKADKIAALQEMREVFRSKPEPKAWAHALRDREQAGERLTPFQRTAWREVLEQNGGGAS